MRIKVFAILKEYLEEDFEIPHVDTVEQLKQRLQSENPRVAAILPSCKFAIGSSFINEQTVLNEHDTIFIIPPSSGG
jgi:molybdopterin synthase sulfur carrier subunit